MDERFSWPPEDDGLDAVLDAVLVDGRPQDALEVRRLCARASARLLGSAQPVRIGRYEVLGPLGSGSSGVVYEAFDPVLRRCVALKVLRMAATNATGIERLRREATTLARLDDPALLTVFDVGVDHEDGQARPYLVTALAPGRDLATWARHQPASRRLIALVRVGIAAARAVERAHRVGVVHRDLKPEHILVADDGEITIIDFGLSPGPAPTSGIGGTPAYAAPELLDGSEPDPRSDQYALCVTLSEGAWGGQPRPGSAYESGMERDVRAVLERGLARRPGDRWPSLGALADALRRCGRARNHRSGLAVAMAAAAVAVWSIQPAAYAPAPRQAPVDAHEPARDAADEARARAQVLALHAEGRRGEALALAERVYEQAERSGSSQQNRAALLLGHMAREHGELDLAKQHFSALYFRASALGRSEAQLRIALEAAAAMVFLHGQGIEALDEGDRWVEHGRAILDRLDVHDQSDAGYFHNAAGVLRAAQYRNDDAIAHYGEAIAIFERAPEMAEAEAAARANLGIVLARITQNEAGAAQLRRALELRLARHGPDAYAVGETLLNLGAVVLLFDPAEALEHLERGGQIMGRYDGRGQQARMVVMETNIGKALLELGRAAEAVEHLRKALALGAGTPDPQLLGVETQLALADALLELGQDEPARMHLQQVRDAVGDVDDLRHQAAVTRLARLAPSRTAALGGTPR